MVGTSKILTVSYGTFSCTLEGFDDSFNTMKAIAEYFRGLASDDRYFGAEPPTPDAEMLASIAEREISRRVEAHMDEGGIVLRAAALSDQSDASGDADAPAHDKDTRAEVEAARKAAKAARKAEKAAAKAERRAAKAALKAKEAAEAEAAEHAEAEAHADAKSEADVKLADDAKVDADAKTADEDTDDAPSESSLLESVSAATAAASEGTTGPDVEETRDTAPSSTLAAKDPAPENMPSGAPEADTAEATSKPFVPAHPDADSVAAKLQRIRAVVGQSGDAPSDDLTAQVLPKTQTPDVADVEDGTAANLMADPATQVVDIDKTASEEDAKPDDATDMISRVMARKSDGDAQPETTEVPEIEAPEAETPEVAEVAVPEATAPRARVVRMKRADFEKAVAAGNTDQADNADEKADAQADTPEEPVVETAPKGPDFGLLDGADELDDYLEDSDFTDADLSGIDDMDLAEDLKAIQADMDVEDVAVDVADDITTVDAVSQAITAQDDAAETTVETVETADIPADEAVDATSPEPQVDDQAVDRLMDETDVQMQEPDGSRRRDAIAQLKAAVAAKEAARQVGEPDEDDQDVENAFRNDLSEAVRPEGSAPRPRPVVRSSTRTERPRPAPLKLVAAQRVDLEDSGAQRDGPVVPRRVAARRNDPDQARATGSFAEFADNMGAKELPDLLEAAAAYTSFVEGADEFSRPQILRRVRSVAADDFKREDELRSFADLITAGRFTKVRNGRFQVADDSRFNPERRAG